MSAVASRIPVESVIVPRRWRGTVARLGRQVRRWPVVAFGALAGVLVASALFPGWNTDNFYPRGVLLGVPCLRGIAAGPEDFFAFLSGDPDRTRLMLERGLVPWYTDTELRAAFWRPLAVATHWLDHQLWSHSAVFMHAQSLAWFGLGITVVAWLYRRLPAPAWAGGMAALLFAIDDAHWMPVAYIANRNVLVTLVFGALGLIAHDAWRTRGWRWGALLAPLLLALAVAGGESGVAFFGYFVAYELFLARDAWRWRVLALAPLVVVLVAWRLYWTAQGYGVAHMGFYVDPGAEPFRFLRAVGGRLPLLLLGQWALPASETSYFLPGRGRLVAQLAAVAFLLVLAAALWPLLRRSRAARFWAAGMVISAIPVCATFPADRLLLIPGIGAMALLGMLLWTVFELPLARPRWPLRAMAGFLVLMHLLLAPVLLPLRAADLGGATRTALKEASVPDDPAIAAQTLVLLNGLSVATPLECQLAGRPAPRALRLLAPGVGPLDVTRSAANTLVLRPRGGFMGQIYERLFRHPSRQFKPGEQVVLSDVTIEITELTADGRPAEARFDFARPLDDPVYCWRYWDGTRWARFPLPSVGKQLRVAG